MRKALVTGSAGLVGSASVELLTQHGYDVVGVDNDMRRYFFGDSATTRPITDRLRERFDNFRHFPLDIRDEHGMLRIMRTEKPDIIIHAAAQPAHDWAASEPFTDFEVNAVGTLNLLEATRLVCPDSTFVYCSTSKVYGDNPNRLPLVEFESRFDLDPEARYYRGIDATMSIDHCTHSLFGASKASADLLVQEYGHYFAMPTVCFRPGCISGANHQGVPLHGFLSYLMRCTMGNKPYQVIGYGGKQVRCNIHAADLVEAFIAFHQDPGCGKVYNIGGGRSGAVSMIEAIEMCQKIAGRELMHTYEPVPRVGDHQWWISDNGPFMTDYQWRPLYDVDRVLREIYEQNEAWVAPA